MAINNPQRFDDAEAVYRTAVAAALASVWTSLPGIIQAYDATTQTATVQPAVQGVVTAPDGSTSLVSLPVVTDVPCQFPSGGGFALTFPVAAGDECLLVFASRGIDAWHALGGVQQPTGSRKHALSDAFAMLGFRSLPHALGAVSTTAVQLRNAAGTAMLEIKPSGQVHVLAPVPMVIDGNVVVNGTITATGDVVAGTVSLKLHQHSGVQTGGGVSGPPVP
jgi:hypothetical protein